METTIGIRRNCEGMEIVIESRLKAKEEEELQTEEAILAMKSILFLESVRGCIFFALQVLRQL